MYSSIHPGATGRQPNNLVNIFGLTFITVAFALLTVYAFTDVIARDPNFTRDGFYALPPAELPQALSYLVALVPLFWLPRRIAAVSDVCIHYLYFFVFVPSCVFLPIRSTLSEGQQISILLTLLGAYGSLEFRRLLPNNGRWSISIGGEVAYGRFLLVSALAFFAIIVSINSLSLDNINFFDVYDQRRQFLSDASTARIITGYAANWAAVAIAPIISLYALMRGKYWFSLFGPVVAFAAFAATSFKSQIFVPLVVIMMYFTMRFLGDRGRGYAIALFALGLTVFSLGYDFLITKGATVTWALQFRFVGNNGFLTAQYFNVFQDMPKGYFADSFGRLFVESYYNVPIAQVVGESFTPLLGNHANANLWADGFGNLGIAGVFFSSAEMIAFMWLADLVTRDRPISITAPAMLSACFALANTAVHSMLSSNGGILLLLLLAAMPMRRNVRDVPLSAEPLPLLR